jgi:chromosome segregation ATPase
MNGPSTDGNENIIDIFVLCKSETAVPIKTEHLEQKGYRVTLFSDSPHLLETLRFGKPNILICDSLYLGQEAFEVCRRIKADADLWMVPVLILTSASSLADLLFVLDSNADNFIACPCDPSYLLSLIEGMLVTPVERQTPEQIKTQFKIQHDEHLFVVTADRRKLLEFLLSSFEIAVNKADDLNRARNEISGLQLTLKKAGESAEEQARVITILNGTLQQKEQAIKSLNEDVEKKSRQIADIGREKEFLVQERETSKARIASMEDEKQALIQQKEAAGRASLTETTGLREQIAALESELIGTRTDLQGAKTRLEVETARCETAESALEELLPQKEQAEKTVRALTLECDQAKSFASAETSRAQAAEQEIRSVLQAKAESEQDLTRIIDELKETVKQKSGDLARIREEREADKSRILALESQAAALATAKDLAEQNLAKTEEDTRCELARLQTTFEATTTALKEKDRLFFALEQECRDHKTIGQQLHENAVSLKAEFASVRSELEARISSLVAEKERVECSLSRTVDDLQHELETVRTSSAATTAAIEEKNRQCTALEQAYAEQKTAGQALAGNLEALRAELGEIRAAFATTSAALEEKNRHAAGLEQACAEEKTAGQALAGNLATLKAELGTIKAALEQEKQRHAATADSLGAALRERDIALSSLQGAHDEVRTDLDAHRDDLVQVKQDLAVANAERSLLKSRLEETTARIRNLESELQAVSGGKAQAAQQSRALADELEQAKAALEAERRQRRSSEEHLTTVSSASAKSDEVLRHAIREQERMSTMLEAEQKESRDAKARAQAEKETHEKRIAELLSELGTATNRMHILEDRIRVIDREKQDAEQKAVSLAAEIDQARTALADEWEDHMTAKEDLAAAVAAKENLEKTMQHTSSPAPVDPAGPLVVAKGPMLPSPLPPTPAAAMVSPTGLETDAGRVTGVDDLFEDPPATTDEPDDEPVVSIVRETDVEVPDFSFPYSSEPLVPVPDDESSEPGFAEEADADGEDVEGEDAEEEDGGDTDDGPDEDDSPGMNPGGSMVQADPVVSFSFNRNQWFDLLKWAHHSGALSQEQRLQIIRMGRLIQRGRRLTPKQDEQVREMIGIAQSLGYRFT